MNENISTDTEVVIPFGVKKVRKHGDYTRVIALDKKALEACGCSDDKNIMAKVELVKRPNHPDQDFLRVTPFCTNEQDEEEAVKGGDKVE